MDVSIIGASGTIGRQIAISLVEDRIIPSTSRLQLVGRRGARSADLLPGLAADLSDAFAETLPEIDVALTPEEVLGDVIVVAAGAAVPVDPARPVDRAALGRENRAILETYARAIARSSHGEEIVLVVTNPVELGVRIFSETHDRRRVIGMGAFLDTLRFRREIAAELGVRRQVVGGLVLGEHGSHMVPCWSTVHAFGFDSDEGRKRLSELHRPDDPSVAEALGRVMNVIIAEGPLAAYRLASSFGPDLRAFLKPYITHYSGARTPVGTSEIITRLVETIIGGRQLVAAAQLALEGEYLDIHGVTGVPVLLSNRGVERVEPVALTEREASAVRRAARHSTELGKAWQ